MKNPILLPVIALALSALLLLGVTFAVNGVAEANAQKEHLRIMRTLLPGSEDFTVEPYVGDDAVIRSVHKSHNGYVIETATSGYAGEITMLIGVKNEGTVTGLVVRDMAETFTLGAEALSDYRFLAQFLNSQGNVGIGPATEDSTSSDTGHVTDGVSGATSDSSSSTVDTYVDGITGATVTSKAIARSINAAVAYVTGADIDSGATS